jgi:hypothetical protein
MSCIFAGIQDGSPLAEGEPNMAHYPARSLSGFLAHLGLLLVAAAPLGCSGEVEPAAGDTGSNIEQGGAGKAGAAGDSSGNQSSAGAPGSTPGSSGSAGASGASGASGAAGTAACDVGAVRECEDSVEQIPYGMQTCEEEAGQLGWGVCKAVACEPGQLVACEADGVEGQRACDYTGHIGKCGKAGACKPYEVKDCGGPVPGMQTRCAVNDAGVWAFGQHDCDTPLVLSFDGAPVSFTHPGGYFDLSGAGACFDTDWVSSATPWLAIDLDGNGQIDDGAELFGSMTLLPSGKRAGQGFAALAALDADGDGQITERDPAFSRLVLWRDLDQDRRSSGAELSPLARSGVTAISLDFHVASRCVGSACERERAAFTYQDTSGVARTGAVIDVHFAR